MAKDRRAKRKSAARRRAEKQTSGYETSVLRVPEGVGFFSPNPGVYTVDIIPYEVKHGNLDGLGEAGGNPHAETGELYYERTFWKYRSIGAEEKDYIAMGKTFGERDYVQEYVNRRLLESDLTDKDRAYIKSLKPKERQIFIVYDHDAPNKGVQIWESSNFCFGELLDSRIKNSKEEFGWDLFYFPDEDGMTLQITIEEVKSKGFTFNKATAIDFFPRKTPIPQAILEHGIDLDEMLIKIPYDKLKAIFNGGTEDDAEGDEDEHRVPADDASHSDHDDEDRRDDRRVGKTEAKQSRPTAQECGIKPQMSVLYKGVECTVAKITADGESLTLIDSDDEVIKGVAPDDVSEIPFEKPKSEPKSEPKTKPKTKVEDNVPFDTDDDDDEVIEKVESKSKAPPGDDDDEAWDADWD